MECACMDFDCDEPAEVFTSQCRKARVSHKCCECHREIKSGEEYTLDKGKWGGEWDEFKTCADCKSLREAFLCRGYEYTSVRAHIEAHIIEAGGAVSSDWIIELTPAAKEWVFSVVEELWAEEEVE